MTYQELQKKYPNTEIKLIPEKFVEQYKTFGFKIVQTGITKSGVDSKYDIKYCFMAEIN